MTILHTGKNVSNSELLKVPSKFGTGEWRIPPENVGAALDWLFENEECARFDGTFLDLRETVMQLKALAVRNAQLETDNERLRMLFRREEGAT